MNIQIGGYPHKDGEIDNPEFYYQAINIINQHRIKSEQAIREMETNKPKQKDEPNIWIYVIAVIIVCLLCVR